MLVLHVHFLALGVSRGKITAHATLQKSEPKNILSYSLFSLFNALLLLWKISQTESSTNGLSCVWVLLLTSHFAVSEDHHILSLIKAAEHARSMFPKGQATQDRLLQSVFFFFNTLFHIHAAMNICT